MGQVLVLVGQVLVLVLVLGGQVLVNIPGSSLAHACSYLLLSEILGFPTEA